MRGERRERRAGMPGARGRVRLDAAGSGGRRREMGGAMVTTYGGLSVPHTRFRVCGWRGAVGRFVRKVCLLPWSTS